MSAYWRLFYHFVWATRNREALIGDEEEKLIRNSFRMSCDDLGLIPHAIGVMPEHVHVVITVPPKIALSEAVRRLKGASANAVNHRSDVRRETDFHWQGGYGALSFGERSLPRVIAYANDQRGRHFRDDLWPGLERFQTEAEADA